MEWTRQFRDLWNRWQALGRGRKIVYLAVFSTCLAVAGGVYYLTQPEYRVLYSGLSGEEAGVITGKLQSKSVPYRLAAGGTTILVPAEQAMQIHVDLTTEGIPGSSKVGKGLDLFDQPSFGSTSFNQHVNFLRAQQGELARTIMQIDPIVYARVHIVRPEPSPFVREQKPTTASVMVKLRPGATLNRNTVAGIAALVAGSIEGLTRDNVRIIDSNGHFLSDHGDGEGGMLGSAMEQRKEVEQYLAGEAERMLSHVLGNGKAIVRVTAELNGKQMHEKREIINAEGRVARSEKTTLKKTSGESGKGGAAGAGSNLGKQTGGQTGGGTKVEETQQSDYDYPRIIQEFQHKHGAIERLTIAAFVDMSSAAEQGFTLAEISEAIKKAVGFKAERDEIQITQVKMPAATNDDFEKEWTVHQQWQNTLALVRHGSLAMIALCAVPFVWVMLRRRLPAGLPAQAAATAEAAPNPKLRRLSDELSRNPEVLASILSRWMERTEAGAKAA